jgi:hypothetical protein
MDKWKKVGTFTKRQLAGKLVVEKLLTLLVRLSPKSKSITDFAVDPITTDYLEDRIRKVHGGQAGFIILQHTPCEYVDGEPFTVYRRVKPRKDKRK